MPPVRVVVFAPPTGRPFGRPNIRNTEIKFLSDEYMPSKEIDIVNHWAVLKYHIEKANEFINTQYKNDPPNTLRLIVAPEWFFRKKNVVEDDMKINQPPPPPPSPPPALTYAPPFDDSDVKKLLKAIIYDSAKAPYNSWLIIPGSVYWGEKSITPQRWNTYNMVPVVYNGRLLSLVHKRDDADTWREHEDWGNDIGNDGTSAEQIEQRLQSCVRRSQNFVNRLGINYTPDYLGVFTCEGIRFGLEICGDHSSSGGGRLLNAFRSRHRETLNLNTNLTVRTPASRIATEDLNAILARELVDIHLLVSCGAGPTPANNMARRSGYIVNADGGVESIFKIEKDDFFTIKTKDINKLWDELVKLNWITERGNLNPVANRKPGALPPPFQEIQPAIEETFTILRKQLYRRMLNSNRLKQVVGYEFESEKGKFKSTFVDLDGVSQKRFYPSDSKDVYRRLIIFNTLLDFNAPARITTLT